MRYTIFYFLLFFYFLINNAFSQLPPPPLSTSEVFPKEVYDRILEDGEFKLNQLGQDSLVFSTKFFSLKMPKLQENVRLNNTRFLIENGNANQKIRINYLLKSAFESRNSPFREERKLRNYLIPFLTGDLYGISEYFLSSNEKKLVENFHSPSSFKVSSKKEFISENIKIMSVEGINLVSQQLEKYYFFEVDEFYFVISYENFFIDNLTLSKPVKNEIDCLGKLKVADHKIISYSYRLSNKLPINLNYISIAYFSKDSLKSNEFNLSIYSPNHFSINSIRYCYDKRRNIIKTGYISQNDKTVTLSEFDNQNRITNVVNFINGKKIENTFEYIKNDSTEIVRNFEIDRNSVNVLLNETIYSKRFDFSKKEMIESVKTIGKNNYTMEYFNFYDSNGILKREISDFNETIYISNSEENSYLPTKNQTLKYVSNNIVYMEKMYDQNGKLSSVVLRDYCLNSDQPKLGF